VAGALFAVPETQGEHYGPSNQPKPITPPYGGCSIQSEAKSAESRVPMSAESIETLA
jgi:hypothetical protein